MKNCPTKLCGQYFIHNNNLSLLYNRNIYNFYLLFFKKGIMGFYVLVRTIREVEYLNVKCFWHIYTEFILNIGFTLMRLLLVLCSILQRLIRL